MVGLNDHRLTPAAQRLATLHGATNESFAKAEEALSESAGFRLSESTIQRATITTGEQIINHFSNQKTFGIPHDWNWYRDAENYTIGYISIDATGVPQQEKQGKAAPGRMAYVGMIYNPIPDLKRCPNNVINPNESMKARYVSGLYELEEMGPLLRQQGAQVGLDRAQRWVALSDGGSGLEDFLRVNFPRVEAVILDFYHASEYMSKLAKALHGNDESKAQEQSKAWSEELRAKGGEEMLKILRAKEWPSSKTFLKVQEEVFGYLENQKHRMDYPTYDKKGWCIGSGAIESACKTVVGQRLKGTGMRWSENGSHAMCHVRALFRSENGQWDAFWQCSLAA